MLSAEHLAEAALANHFVHFVLVDHLTHVEGSPLGFEVKCVSILQEVNVLLTNLQPAKTVQKSLPPIVRFTLLFTQCLQEMTELLHVC